jgi:environmental stress-induced protein Ves
MKRLFAGQHARMPWKNGLGISHVIASDPPGAAYDALAWQVAATEVTAHCPFSSLPGLDRLFMVIEGAGVELKSLDDHGATRTQSVLPLRPYAFRGDWPTECRLLEGPVKVFNVIARRGTIKAALGFLEGTRVESQAGHTILAVDLATLEAWQLAGEERADIERGSGPVARVSLAG